MDAARKPASTEKAKAPSTIASASTSATWKSGLSDTLLEGFAEVKRNARMMEIPCVRPSFSSDEPSPRHTESSSLQAASSNFVPEVRLYQGDSSSEISDDSTELQHCIHVPYRSLVTDSVVHLTVRASSIRGFGGVFRDARVEFTKRHALVDMVDELGRLWRFSTSAFLGNIIPKESRFRLSQSKESLCVTLMKDPNGSDEFWRNGHIVLTERSLGGISASGSKANASRFLVKVEEKESRTEALRRDFF
eukprot:TRINITY_DN70808_c0_g1_i1.p1 TRINITY_DN70808_c0_g1~~TRINITY_DN70808_c0_g1_i1.p1  ORF type:complete len:249 (+),score=31.88 TRINITY_DN70808_c0_g1_i1:121-867(+)